MPLYVFIEPDMNAQNIYVGPGDIAVVKAFSMKSAIRKFKQLYDIPSKEYAFKCIHKIQYNAMGIAVLRER